MTIRIVDPTDPLLIRYEFPVEDLHGQAAEKPPEFHSRSQYFWATNTTVEQIGGNGQRQLEITAIVNKATVVGPDDMVNLLNLIDREQGTFGSLEIRKVFASTIYYKDCVFMGAERIPQSGQRSAVFLPNLIPYPIGPKGSYWIEVNLIFKQVSIQ